MPNLMFCSKFADNLNAAFRPNFCQIYVIRSDTTIMLPYKANLSFWSIPQNLYLEQ